MSDSLKQDVINVVGNEEYTKRCKEIEYMYDDAEKGVCSNIQIDTTIELCLYNVQFSIYHKNTYHLINKFVYAINADDAKKIVTKRYLDYVADTTNIYCQKVDIRRGLMFSYNRGDL